MERERARRPRLAYLGGTMHPPILSRRTVDRLPGHEIARGDGGDVILQAFHWNLVKTRGTGTMDGRAESWYRVLTDMAEQVAALGFTIVYLPPPWRDDSEWQSGERSGGGEGYFWHDFDLDSRYGSKAELTALVTKLHALGVRVIVDVVINHRDKSRMREDVWEWPGPCWAVGGHDTGGGFDRGENDLALDYPVVHARIRAAMNELLEECGVDGYRWDFVWGYSVEDVIALLEETPKAPYFSMGEYWQGDPTRPDDPMIERYGTHERARIVGWACDTRSCAYDVLLKKQVQTADPRNLRLGLNASRRRGDREVAVTYVDNHDTGASPSCAAGSGQRHWECPPHFKSSAYAFVLSMPGTPSVYWPDCFDWGMREEIAALIAARQRAGIVAASEWTDLCDAHSGFAGIVQDAHGKDALALSIGSDYTGPGAGWVVAHEKRGEWTVWVRDGLSG